MTKIIIDLDDPKLHEAAQTISTAIQDQFPTARIEIEESLDPPKLYVIAVVDVDDIELVMDCYLDTLVDFQVEDHLPLDVIVMRTPERQKADLDEARTRNRLPVLDSSPIGTSMETSLLVPISLGSGGLLESLTPILEHPAISAAIDELTAMILDEYPGSKIDAELGDDPLGVYLLTIVDLDEPDEVMDLVIDRLVELNVEDRIPIHVIPLRTDARERAMRAEAAKGMQPLTPLELL